MFETLLDGSQVNVVIAFIGGFITFFASCLLPLVPTYLAYLSGVSLNEDTADSKRWQILTTAIFFVAGFIITFVTLGLTLNTLNSAVNVHRATINRAAGLFFILMGLFMLNVFQHPWFLQERRIDVHDLFTKHRKLHALVTGIAFGFGWTPCIGPVLAVILFWAAQAETALAGTALLVSYGLGLGIPFLLVALGFEKLVPLLKKYRRVSQYVNYLSAGMLLMVGVLLATGYFQYLSLVFLDVLNLRTLAI